jgi:hypothetical protein
MRRGLGPKLAFTEIESLDSFMLEKVHLRLSDPYTVQSPKTVSVLNISSIMMAQTSG